MLGLLESVLERLDLLLEALYFLRRKALFIVGKRQGRGGRGRPLESFSEREPRVRLRGYPSVASLWVWRRADEQRHSLIWRRGAVDPGRRINRKLRHSAAFRLKSHEPSSETLVNYAVARFKYKGEPTCSPPPSSGA